MDPKSTPEAAREHRKSIQKSDPKRSENGAKTDPKMEPEMDQIELLGVGPARTGPPLLGPRTVLGTILSQPGAQGRFGGPKWTKMDQNAPKGTQNRPKF